MFGWFRSSPGPAFADPVARLMAGHQISPDAPATLAVAGIILPDASD
jgi:hypothetical protein